MTQEVFFKRYSIDFDNGWLGEGTFGTVYKAYDNTYSTWKAIKISKVRLIDGKKFSLISEFEATQALPPHPNIANYEAVYQYQMANGMFDYAIMQFYDEGNLKQLLQNNVLDFKEKSNLADGLIEGLTYLHQYKIIHRDIKPSNIMIVKDPNGKFVPKIADFGLSRFIDNDASFMTNSFGGGTLEYSSPEQLYCKPLKYNSDLWSFGVITFELFAGVRPFGSEDDGSTEAKRLIIYQKIVKAELPTTIESIPEPYKQVIKKCLVKDPNERVNNGREIVNYIRNFKNNDILPGQDDEKTYILTKEEKTSYELALSSTLEFDSEKFIQKYPESIFRLEISEHLKKLKVQSTKNRKESDKKQNHEEEESYALILKEDKEKHYKWFLNKYPKSKYNSSIHSKLLLIQQARKNKVISTLKKYSYILLLPLFYLAFVQYQRMSIVNIYESKGKFGLKSTLSGKLTDPLYDDIKSASKGQYLVSQFNRKFLIDDNGDFVSEYNPNVNGDVNQSNNTLNKEWVLKANLSELKSVINKDPDTKYLSLIKSRINLINETESGKLFKKIRGSRNINELQGFLTKYPNVSKSTVIKNTILEITKNYSESELFAAAKQSFSLVLFKSYLKRFPDGQYIDEVNEFIVDLEESSKQLSQ